VTALRGTNEASQDDEVTDRGDEADNALLRIAVADDDPMIRRVVGLVLNSVGFSTVEAETGAALLTLLVEAGPFDVIIADMNMPRLSGVAVARLVRAAGLPTPFIIMTADPGRARILLGHTPDTSVSVLCKPFGADSLLAAILRARRPRRLGGLP